MLDVGELDEWGRLVIHLVVGGFHRLQPPHSFSLLHCRGAIFSVLIFTLLKPFICTLFKKDPEDPPQHPAPPGVTKLESPELLRRPHLNQTNASFDAQGAPASPPPGTALSRHTPHSGLSFSPSLCEDFAAPHWIGTRRW